MIKTHMKRWYIVAFIAFVVIFLGAFLILKRQAHLSYLAGIEAHQSLDADFAITNYVQVVKYPTILGEFISDAGIKLTECQAYNNCKKLWDSGQYNRALDSYASFIEKYPNSFFAENSSIALIKIPFEWAESLARIGDYIGAVDLYEKIIADVTLPEETITRAMVSRSTAYLEWGQAFANERNYAEAIDRFLEVQKSSPDNKIVVQAEILIRDSYFKWIEESSGRNDFSQTEGLYQTLLAWQEIYDPRGLMDIQSELAHTYADWGKALHGTGEFDDAVEKLQLAIRWLPDKNDETEFQVMLAQTYLDWGIELHSAGTFSDAIDKLGLAIELGTDDVIKKARDATGDVYLEWAVSLYDSNSMVEAGDKYGTLLFKYADTTAASKIPNHVPLALIAWGKSILESNEYKIAYDVFMKSLNLVADGQEEIRAEAYLGCGLALQGQGRYTEAITNFQQAYGMTNNAELSTIIEDAEQAAVHALSEDTRIDGQNLMMLTLEDICVNGSPAESPAVGISQDEIRFLSYKIATGTSPLAFYQYTLNEEPKPIDLSDDIEAIKPAHFRYAACIIEDILPLEACAYNAYGSYRAMTTHHIVRQIRRYVVTIYDVASGNILTQRTFQGLQPDYCPWNYSFGGRTIKFFTGPPPSMDEVNIWLESFVR